MICTFKSTLTNGFSWKISERKILSKKRINAGRIRAKSLSPWCLISEGTGAAKTRVGKSAQSQTNEKGVHTALRRSPSPTPSDCCDRTWGMWPAAGTEGSLSHSAVTRQPQPCQLPPSSHWEKGTRSRTRGRRAPCRLPPPPIPGWPLDSSDVAIPSGVWRQKGKGRSLQRASKDEGCYKRNRGVLWKDYHALKCFSGEGAILCFPFCSDERSRQGRSWSIPRGPSCHCSSVLSHTAICWPFQRKSQPPLFQLRRQFLIKKTNFCCLNGKCSLLAAVLFCCDILECLQKLKNKNKNLKNSPD